MVRRRQKASDVWNETTPFMGTTGSFTEAFPQIRDLRITVEEEGEGTTRPLLKRSSIENVYTLNHPPGQHVDCHNPLCYGGGIALGNVLRQMVSAGETELEFCETCRGYEGSPKGRKKYRDCLNVFKVKIQLVLCDTE